MTSADGRVRCGYCHRTVRVRGDGTLVPHNDTPPRWWAKDAHIRCDGSERPAADAVKGET